MYKAEWCIENNNIYHSELYASINILYMYIIFINYFLKKEH